MGSFVWINLCSVCFSFLLLWKMYLCSTSTVLKEFPWHQTTAGKLVSVFQIFNQLCLFFRTSSRCRTSLLSWVWMSCLRRTSWLCHVPGKCRDSFPSHSRWLRCSLAQRASTSTSRTPLPDSRRSWRVRAVWPVYSTHLTSSVRVECCRNLCQYSSVKYLAVQKLNEQFGTVYVLEFWSFYHLCVLPES